MGLTVIGIFDNTAKAKQAVDALISMGLPQNNIALSPQLGKPISDDVLVSDQAASPNSLPAEKLITETELIDDSNYAGQLVGHTAGNADELVGIRC